MHPTIKIAEKTIKSDKEVQPTIVGYQPNICRLKIFNSINPKPIVDSKPRSEKIKSTVLVNITSAKTDNEPYA